MPGKLKLFGERHTNTNYLSKLIELNLDCLLIAGVVPTYIRTIENLLGRQWLRDAWFARQSIHNFGWKHSVVGQLQPESNVVFVTLTKNPYAWLLSMYRRPYHQHYKTPPSFEEFLQLPWQTVGRENLPGPVQNPIVLWNIKNASYRSLPSEQTLHLTTESTFEDAAMVINKIAKTFNLARLQEEFVDFNRSTKKRLDRDGDYYRDYYLNERWRAELSDDAIKLINQSLDKELLDFYGYNLL